MLDIQMKQLSHAQHILDILKCEYAIRLPDGALVGTLEVVKQPKKKKIRPRKDYSSLNIQERVRAMQVGEVIEIMGTEEFTLEEIQCNASSCGTTTFGPGAFTTSRNHRNRTVECLRIK